jgi:hypothetical protein
MEHEHSSLSRRTREKIRGKKLRGNGNNKTQRSERERQEEDVGNVLPSF